jgi:glyoxylase-like metal-dependent hydrolase (beta-lactamase superfamily II)
MMQLNDTRPPAFAAAGLSFIERGWLSANNILFQGDGPSALVDTGYCTHADQTMALVGHALNGRSLDLLLNTHLHSDHCGGNAALQGVYPSLKVLIPPGQAQAVTEWDPVALTFEPTGQQCPRFIHHGLLLPDTTIQLGPLHWDIHAAKGHDPHSIVLFQPEHKILISADALWENGFGVVFPELEGISAFDEVAETLTIIEQLGPTHVIPGHGRVFDDVHTAINRARTRLDQFVQRPDKHRRHALKVLLKYKLLEWQTVTTEHLLNWVRQTPYLSRFMPEQGRDAQLAQDWLNELLFELQRSGAIRVERDQIVNT